MEAKATKVTMAERKLFAAFSQLRLWGPAAVFVVVGDILVVRRIEKNFP